MRSLVLVLGIALLFSVTACNLPGAHVSAGPTPTATPVIVYQSSLTTVDNTWTNNALCSFKSDGYHINAGFICFAPAGILADVDVSVQVEQLLGFTTPPYGIVFRRESQGNYYEFAIDSDSEWVFSRCVSATCTKLKDFTANAAILGGLNTKNKLEVRALGSHFEFFVNGTQVGQADDTAYINGKVGLAGFDSIDVVYTNIKVIRPSPSAQPSPTM